MVNDVLGRTRTISNGLPDQDQHRNPYPAGRSGLQASSSHCHTPGPAPLANKGKRAKGKPPLKSTHWPKLRVCPNLGILEAVTWQGDERASLLSSITGSKADCLSSASWVTTLNRILLCQSWQLGNFSIHTGFFLLSGRKLPPLHVTDQKPKGLVPYADTYFCHTFNFS